MLFIAFRMAYYDCFCLGANLDFLHKSFLTLTTEEGSETKMAPASLHSTTTAKVQLLERRWAPHNKSRFLPPTNLNHLHTTTYYLPTTTYYLPTTTYYLPTTTYYLPTTTYYLPTTTYYLPTTTYYYLPPTTTYHLPYTTTYHLPYTSTYHLPTTTTKE